MPDPVVLGVRHPPRVRFLTKEGEKGENEPVMDDKTPNNCDEEEGIARSRHVVHSDFRER